MPYFVSGMESFRTTFKIPESTVKLDYQSNILLMGSCFTENIGKRLSTYKFRTLSNPSGIIFNPVSIANSLKRIIRAEEYKKAELIHYYDQWLSLEHHGSFSHEDANEALQHINESLKQAHTFLKDARLLILTFGTAWVYRYKETDDIVANCHKLPASVFDKQLLSVADITEKYSQLLTLLKDFYPGLEICFTLSPVRHWRDGAVENQRSKSTLHIAIQQLVEDHANCHYFPAYELQMDDLRDYRFYEADMIHPNAQAVEYIWDHFRQTWMAPQLFPFVDKLEKLSTAMHHRPHQADSEAYRKFAAQQLEIIQSLQKEQPGLGFGEEMGYFRSKLE
jgi:hypothetical protein